MAQPSPLIFFVCRLQVPMALTRSPHSKNGGVAHGFSGLNNLYSGKPKLILFYPENPSASESHAGQNHARQCQEISLLVNENAPPPIPTAVSAADQLTSLSLPLVPFRV